MSSTQTIGRIKCGNCKGYHDTTSAVRACCLGTSHEPMAAKVSDFVQAREAVVRKGQAATDKQQAFILSLLDERPTFAETVGYKASTVPGLTKAEASNWIKELLGAKKETSTYAKPGTVAAAFVYPEIAEGHYAVVSETGNNDLDFFRIDRPTDGRWAGRTFVKRVVGGKPEFAVRGPAAIAIVERIIAAGTKDAALRYGMEIGRCCKCNRSLTDETSRAFGMGPDCRSNAGW